MRLSAVIELFELNARRVLEHDMEPDFVQPPKSVRDIIITEESMNFAIRIAMASYHQWSTVIGYEASSRLDISLGVEKPVSGVFSRDSNQPFVHV